MNTKTILTIIAVSLLAVVSRANALSLSVDCVEATPEGLLVYVGYTSDVAFDGVSSIAVPDGASIVGTPPGAFAEGTFSRVFAIQFSDAELSTFWHVQAVDVFDSLFVSPDGVKRCSPDNGSGEPDGGLETITKEVAPGCYEWSIQDEYGHWSTAAATCSQQEGERVFVRLVLGKDNPVIDPARYQVWRVEDD